MVDEILFPNILLISSIADYKSFTVASTSSSTVSYPSASIIRVLYLATSPNLAKSSLNISGLLKYFVMESSIVLINKQSIII